MKNQKFSIINRLLSFKHAFSGLSILIKEEHNARIHLVASICVIIVCLVFKISLYEWIAIIFAVGLVFCLEIINSSIENIADFISPEKHEMIKKINQKLDEIAGNPTKTVDEKIQVIRDKMASLIDELTSIKMWYYLKK